MLVRELLEALGIEVANEDEVSQVLDKEISVHYQQSYPLRAEVSGVVQGDTNIHLATYDTHKQPYGSKCVWDDRVPSWDSGNEEEDEE